VFSVDFLIFAKRLYGFCRLTMVVRRGERDLRARHRRNVEQQSGV
jgi:hypothetical protein